MTTAEDKKNLQDITRAARDGHLTEVQMQELRDMIFELKSLRTEDQLLKSSIYNAKVFDTQLRDLMQRLAQDDFTPAQFSALPPYLQSRIKSRLQNITERTEATLKALDQGEKMGSSPIFRCKEEFEACREKSPDKVGSFWCQIAMATCLAASAYKMAFK